VEMDAKEWPTERVSKLDVARRQLRTAIRLFFEEGDSVSIYTLTAASHELLRTLVKPVGGASILKDRDSIKPNYQKRFEAHMNVPQNFFKHAAHDPGKVLMFQPQTTAFWIFDCIMMDAKLARRRFEFCEFRGFMIWWMLEFPDFLKPGAADLIPENIRRDAQKLGNAKRYFLALIDRPDLLPMPDVD
jgi:hypothetical protein